MPLNSFIRHSLITVLLLWNGSTLAQRQGNIWYFGNYAGLDFNSGSPVPLTDGALRTNEGCATISDKAGNLLFYTDGISVWNRNHVTMSNGIGLLGDPSSSQCGVIVPRPAKNVSAFYVFSVDDHGGPNGFRYSLVDMNLNGGLGDVAVKNVPILNPTTEKVTAVRHANNRDIWVITHRWNSNAFYAYLVDSLTFNTTPVVSSTGIVHGGSTTNSMGYMKASPEGDKIACAIHGSNIVELFDFNDSTGVISNPKQINLTSWQLVYGLEFSPNGQYLYTTTTQSKEIHQFDVSLGTAVAIKASAVLLGHYPNGAFLGALQLARDGKIYVAISGSPALGVINKPNQGGLACDYVHNGQPLGGRVSFLGLPTFVQSFFAAADFEGEFFCHGDTTHFYLTDTTSIDSVKWNFGDPGSGGYNFSTSTDPYHYYAAPDTYLVSLYYYGNGVTDTIEKEFVIHPRVSLNLGNDTTLCNGTTLTLDATNPESTYLWSTGSTDSTLAIALAGTYWVQVTNYCDTVSDAILIGYAPVPSVNLGPDTAICQGDTLVLNATYASSAYMWQDSSTQATFSAAQSGTYWVEVDNGCMTVFDSVDVTFLPPLQVDLGPDTILCSGDAITFYAYSPGSTYQWSTGSQLADLTASTQGTYWVVVTNVCETQTDTVVITTLTPPTVDLGIDTIICSGDEVPLNVYVSGYTYLWNTGSTDSAIVAATSDLYWVEVTNACGFDIDFRQIDVLEPPAVILAADTSVCPGETVTLTVPQQTAAIIWNDNSTAWNLTVANPGMSWATVSNMCGIDRDTFWLSFHPVPDPQLGQDTSMCYDEAFILDAGAGMSYLWQDGSAGQVYEVWEPGIYIVTVTNVDGCEASDTVRLGIACLPELYVPTGFTPNGDGLNDELLVVRDHITDFHLSVFDRWGTRIFETADVAQGWDGTFGGREMPIGTYVYVISYRDIVGIPYRTQGNVTLLR